MSQWNPHRELGADTDRRFDVDVAIVQVFGDRLHKPQIKPGPFGGMLMFGDSIKAVEDLWQ